MGPQSVPEITAKIIRKIGLESGITEKETNVG